MTSSTSSEAPPAGRRGRIGKSNSIKFSILAALTVCSLLDTLETIVRYQLDLDGSSGGGGGGSGGGSGSGSGSEAAQSFTLLQTGETPVAADEAEMLACAKLAASAQISSNPERCDALATLINNTLNSHHEPGESHLHCGSGRCRPSISVDSVDDDGDHDDEKAKPQEDRLVRWRQTRPPAGWFSIIKRVAAIRLVRVEAPRSVVLGQPIRLRCLFETKGDKLQSLSWLKNGREFYRYQPFERRHPVLVFNLTGINVDLTRSRNGTVVLTNTTSDTSGLYKCQATGSTGFTFQEVNMDAFITVKPAVGSGVGSMLTASSLDLPQILIAVLVLTDSLIFFLY